MKKLLVIALAAIMVLSMAAVSMAAVTVGGEVGFGFNLTGNDPVGGEFVQNDTGYAKVTAKADLNEKFSAFAALLADPIENNKVEIDEAWIQMYGMVKVGWFDYNVKDNMDIFVNLQDDLKNEAGIQVSAPVADGVTVKGYVGRPEEETTYSLGVDYSNDAFGGSVHLVNSTVEDYEMLTAVNAFYNFGPAKAYVNYETQDDNDAAFIGGLYDSDSIYGRVEYQVVKPDNQDDSNIGFRVGYKLGNGVKVEYNSATDYMANGPDAEAVSSLKLIATF